MNQQHAQSARPRNAVRTWELPGLVSCLLAATTTGVAAEPVELGREIAVPRHLANGEEFVLPIAALLEHGERLFGASWTMQEGGGRPLSKGTGAPLADTGSPLVFPRNFNRVSGPDSNACSGCHNLPRAGGGGDRVANVFVLGQRFDFASFSGSDAIATRGALDENLRATALDNIGNERSTVGMFGSGYVEMLARQMTRDLQALRDRLAPGDSVNLVTTGVDFGVLALDPDGRWDTSGVLGLPAPSLRTNGADGLPGLVIRPFHQAGAVVSLREFTNNAFNHHHGIQSEERFGPEDPDGDGFARELTRADVTAVAVFQATLPVPGRVIPRNRLIERAVLQGEVLFADIGCAACHRPELTLDVSGRMYSEPNPYNPEGNLRPGDGPELVIDLNSHRLPLPRLRIRGGRITVPVYSDFKLHDITTGPDDPNCEPLDMHEPAGSREFVSGNCRFMTRRLWGAASEPPYFHHGKFTTLREAILAHYGEAQESRDAWDGLEDDGRNAIIEFLKTLQVLPEGSRHTVVDEHGRWRKWPPRP